MNRIQTRKGYFFAYSIIFFVMFCAIFSIFLTEGRSLIRTADGLNQYYYTLVYYSRLLRQIGQELFINHNILIPMWDMSIGYGSDILTTLNYYGVGDPLNLLCVFFNKDSMEICFILLLFIRFYFAGAFFSIFSLRHHNSQTGSLIGSIIYVFSGFSLYLVMQYAAFVSAILYFPLVLIGIDRILENKKPFLYVFSVFLCAISNFYFFYMISIFMVIYAVLRFFYLNKSKVQNTKELIKTIFGHIVRFLGYYLVGVLLALPILLPVIKVFLSEGRTKVHYHIPMAYSIIRYIVMAVSMFFSYEGEYTGYTLLLLPVLVVILLRKENTIYRILISCVALFMAVPIFGSVFNGFSYVTTRWYFGIAMVAAYLIAHFYEEIYQLTLREKIMVVISTVVLCILEIAVQNEALIEILIIALFTVVVISSFKLNRIKLMRMLVVICSFGSIAIIARNNYSSTTTNNSIWNYIELGSADSAYQSGVFGQFEEYIAENPDVYHDLTGQYRISKIESHLLNESNISLINGWNGTQFYFSIYNGNIAEFNQNLNINSINDFRYDGVDSRSILLNLLNIKYLLSEQSDRDVNGFDTVLQTDSYCVLKNQTETSLGYTYSQYSDYEDWNALNAVERQYAMLQTVFLDKTDHSGSEVSAALLEQNSKELPFQYGIESDRIDITENEWNVIDTETSLFLNITEALEETDAEYYVVIEGLDYINGESTNTHIYFKTNNASDEIFYLNENHTIYTDKHDYICNLGNLNSNSNSIQIQFENAGKYTFDNIRIICQPLSQTESYLEALFQNKLENVIIGENCIKGTITLNEEKILCMAVPYSSGWHAYIDGEKTKIYQANGMMMAVFLDPGDHDIVFRYITPGFILGCIGALIGIVLCIMIVLYQKRHVKSSLNQKEESNHANV